MTVRNSKILRAEETALLIIDIQEKILQAMQRPEEISANALKLIRGCKLLNVPVLYTEQYPKGLGPTVKDLKDELVDGGIEKLTFSCAGAGTLFEDLIRKGIKQVIVCGIESHVCVQQTVMDLLANGFQVDVAADAVSSRRVLDYEIALERMRAHGAEVTTTESILFEMLQTCEAENFKAISKLIR